MALYKITLETVITMEGFIEAEDASAIRNTIETEQQDPQWWGTKTFTSEATVRKVTELKEVALTDA